MNDIERAIEDLKDLSERSSISSTLFKERHGKNFKLAISALEKQMPKKVECFNGLNETCCPECHFVFGYSMELGEYDGENYNYCVECGQKLDWSEME